MEYLSGAALLTATLTIGLMAGVFGLYAHTIMPGLRRTDDRCNWPSTIRSSYGV